MLSIIPEETQAILIGASQFPKDKSLCPLPGVVNNVHDLAELLCDYQIIGIPQTNVTVILDEASASTVVDRLAQTARKATDTLIVYYSGHGLIGKGSAATKLLLAVGDTTQADSPFNALALETIKEAIQTSPATKKILIIDSCFSGRALPKMSDDASYIRERIVIKGAYTIASVPGNEQADAPEGERHTAFSGKLIEAIQNGIDNQQPEINLEELFQHVKTKVVEAGFLEPQRSTVRDADQIVLFRNRSFKPTVTPSIVFIGDAGDPTLDAYRLAAKQCIENSCSPRWIPFDRHDVCYASDPLPEVCTNAVNTCGVYIALLGNFYGHVYDSENVSETELELRAAIAHKQNLIVFILPEETTVTPGMDFIMAQGPLIPRQIEFKTYVQSQGSQVKLFKVNAIEELQANLIAALLEIAQQVDQLTCSPEPVSLATSIAQKVSFLGEYEHLSYDRRPVLAHTLNDLDQQLIEHFLTQPQAKAELAQANLLRASKPDHLRHLGLIHDNNPALGAYLCFAPRSLLVSQFAACSLALCVYDNFNRGDANASPEQVTDNLLNLLELGMNFLRDRAGLSRTGQIDTQTRDDLEIPEIALKEALANALVHRDYEAHSNYPTRIDVYPDRVEVISFGKALVDFNQNPEDIISTQRNYAIAKIFRIMQQVELNASGISRMHSAMRRAKLPDPIIKTSNQPDAVRVIFRRPSRSNQDASANSDFTITEIFTGPSSLKAGAPFQAPPLPSYFVDRPEYRTAIKANVLSQVGRSNPELFTSASKPGTLVVSAIYGLGGIGKSVLAAAIAHDREVHAQFPDGIFWVTLGQTPDLLPLLSDWIQALGDYDYKPVTKEAASTHLQTQLYDKRALLIVDDVWNPEDAEYFRVGGAECCVLVTTREAQISGAARYDLDVMTPNQSMKLMTQAMGEELSEPEKTNVQALAREVGYLPLALELAAAQVEYGVTWTEILADLRAEVARLESLDRTGLERIDEAKRRKHSLVASFNLSLQQLSEQQRGQFAWLGVVPEDVTITQKMAATLWQVSSRQAGAILRTFRAKALLLSGARQNDKKLGYRMHDLMHDRAKELLTSDPTPIEDGKLAGLGVALEVAHRKFLDAYRAQTQDGLWHTLPDDGYIHAHLTWHLEKAGLADEVHALLQEANSEGRNGWYDACDSLGRGSNFVADVARAWGFTKDLFDINPCQAITLQCRYALIKASLNSLAQSIPAELMAALVEQKLWQPTQGLAYVQQIQEPWQKATAIKALFPYLSAVLVPKALEVTRSIQDESSRASALCELAQQMPELLPEALEVTRSIQSELSRASALRELAQQMPELLPEALEVTRSIQSESSRASALRELAQQLPPELLPGALEVTRSIQSEYFRASALRELAQQMPELLPEALEVTRSIQSESSRASALRELAQQLPPELLPEALEVTRSIQSEYFRASALHELAQQMPELLPEALEVARSIQSESSRASALRELAQQMPELLPEALEVTRSIQSELSRASALRELAQQMPELLPEALEVTRSIQSESSRASALRELAQQLPPELLPKALEVTHSIQEEYFRAFILRELAQKLPPELLPKALEVTRSIQSEYFRASALSELAKQLPPELLPEALEVTRSIQSESSRASALRELAKQLPELLPEALEVTRSIQSESSRAYALCELTQQMPELLPEALEVTRSIQDESSRAYALCKLTQQMPELLPEALEVTRSIQSESSRAYVLVELAQQMPPELLPEAFEVTRSIQDEPPRAHALSELAKQLPPELLPEALKMTRSIQFESSRASALCELAKQLPELLPEALEVTRSIQSESSRASALCELAKQLPELLPEALEVTRSIQEELSRANALCKLTQQMPELLPEALEVTRSIQEELYRANALCKLAKQLPPELLPEALEVTRSIQDESSRANALGEFAKHLPESWLVQVLEIIYEIKSDYFRTSALGEILPRLDLASLDFQFWQKTLQTFSSQVRSTFLRDYLPKLSSMILQLGGEDALRGTVEVMRDVSRQWP